jgi:hypothetical protein
MSVSALAPAQDPRASVPLIGVDFTSRPDRRKPVLLAQGECSTTVVVLRALHRFDTLGGLAEWLRSQPRWVGGFDLPFGLPRELVLAWSWPTDWARCIDRFVGLDRAELRARFVAFCASRTPGAKFAHRACDRPAGSSPSMKWVNPPVAWMLHAGVPLLRSARAHFPAHEAEQPGAPRVALEAYPGLLAREVIGRRSYKSDDAARQTADRQLARQAIVEALEAGRTRLDLRLRTSDELRAALIDEARGDALDATLCLVQAAWATKQPRWGLPEAVNPLEGWITSA